MIDTTQYTKMLYDAEKSLCTIVSIPESADLNVELYKELILEECKWIRSCKPKKFMMDMRELQFTVSPDIQKWVGYNFLMACIESGTDKIAIVQSKDLFVEVSVEQTVEELEKIPIPLRYFGDIIKARTWLFE